MHAADKKLIIPNVKNGSAACDYLERILRFQLDKNSKAKFDAKLRQRQIAEAERDGGARFTALGQPVMNIDFFDYLCWMKAEPGCFYDRGFLKKFVADNPQVRVKGPKSKYI